MKGILSRLIEPKEQSENPLRTNSIVGVFVTFPASGKSFTIMGDPIVPTADGRLVRTSPAVVVEPAPGGYKFTTMSGSTYLLEVLHDE